MQTLLRIDEIAQRLKVIGLTPKELSKRAGVNFATFYRGRQRPDSTSIGNLDAFGRALVSREIELRDYLLALHPLGSFDGTASPMDTSGAGSVADLAPARLEASPFRLALPGQAE